jgi:hypothetical protein
MDSTLEAQDRAVRIALYEHAVERSVPPRVAALADRCGLPVERVRESLERLAAARAVVLQPESREILMAAPFSAVPTAFAVRAAGRTYHANCIWDALGIPAMLAVDALVETACACCGEAMAARVEAGRLAPLEGVVHFAVPAHRWWQDIVHA